MPTKQAAAKKQPFNELIGSHDVDEDDDDERLDAAKLVTKANCYFGPLANCPRIEILKWKTRARSASIFDGTSLHMFSNPLPYYSSLISSLHLSNVPLSRLCSSAAEFP